jgi:hypothetical protein
MNARLPIWAPAFCSIRDSCEEFLNELYHISLRTINHGLRLFQFIFKQQRLRQSIPVLAT